MMMVWALMGHIINIIFKMKYELHVYEIENVFKKWNEKKTKTKKKKTEFHFENWFWNEIEFKFNFDFKWNSF